MSIKRKDGTGVLFKNLDKGKNEKAPDYKGEIKLDGKIRRIAMWNTKGKSGMPYFSLKEDTWEKPQKEEEPTGTPYEPQGIDDDDVPF